LPAREQHPSASFTPSSGRGILLRVKYSAKPIAYFLLKNGTDLRFIEEDLGYKRSTRIEIYTHVSTKNLQNIKSPFDDL